MTPIEAALHFCETFRDSVARARIAVSEIRQTIERTRETRRRTEEIRRRHAAIPSSLPLLDKPEALT